ncbi:MAG: DNA primase [Bacilli bacterium]|nr:DNA primase [Bacilli bacterium]
MAYVDDMTINAIRRKHPIREIVERYVSLTKRGEDYWGLCPFHPDNNASMSVSTKLDMFQCFACHKAGNIFNFIAGMENISYGDAIRLLAKEDGYDVGNVVKYNNPYSKDYEIMSLASKFYQNNLNSNLGVNAIKYLDKRQIGRDTIKKFEIGLSTSRQPLIPFLKNKYKIEELIDLGLANDNEMDVFDNRIMIPIHDLNGNHIGFGGRIYQTKDPSKYVNTRATKIFDKSKILYNYHRAHEKLNKNDSIIIMEGYFDVIRASTVGVDNCVAPMGTSLTKQHIGILKKITNNIILCFDGDRAGREATIRTIELLENENINVKVIDLEGRDPDEFIIEMGKDAFIDKVNNPINVIDFKMQVLKENKNLNDTKEISSYLDAIIKELVKEKDSFTIELTLKQLEKKFNIDYETLKERFDNYKKKVVRSNKNNIKVENNKEKKVLNKYGQATNNLLYYMAVSPEIIDDVTKKVIMIMNDKKRRLFNEIIYFYHKYGSIILADFITYLNTKTDIYDVFEEIINMNLKKEYSEQEINDYIKCVNEYYQLDKIEKLKLELNTETDPMKQANILMEIMKIRGVNNND